MSDNSGSLGVPSEINWGKNERSLWLADKLTGDYGSEAAQLLRWYASNVPVAQTGERSQQGQQAEVAPSSAPRVAEVADATSAGDSSTAGMGEPAGQTAPKEQRTPHSLPSALPDPLSKLDGMAQGCMFMADEGVRPDEWMLREWSQKLRAIHSALSETAPAAGETPRTNKFRMRHGEISANQHDNICGEWIRFASQLERELAAAHDMVKLTANQRDAALLASSAIRPIAALHKSHGLTAEMIQAHYPLSQHQEDECEMCDAIHKIAQEAINGS